MALKIHSSPMPYNDFFSAKPHPQIWNELTNLLLIKLFYEDQNKSMYRILFNSDRCRTERYLLLNEECHRLITSLSMTIITQIVRSRNEKPFNVCWPPWIWWAAAEATWGSWISSERSVTSLQTLLSGAWRGKNRLRYERLNFLSFLKFKIQVL